MKRMAEIITSILFITNGILCITCADLLQDVLPIISASIAILSGIILLIKAIKEKEYTRLETKDTATAIIMIIMGIAILFNTSNAIYLIGVSWGIYGLVKGINGINTALYNKYHNNKFILITLHASIEIMLAIALVFNPFEKISHHIVLLGIEMILVSGRNLFKENKKA